MMRTRGLVAAAAVVFGGCLAPWAAAQDNNAGAARIEPAADLADRIDRAILKHKLGQFWGGVLVARDGQVVLAKGYGYANESLDPITADSLFDIGSVAKSFTAAAILRLEMDGKLKTSDPVAAFFPDLDLGERGQTVTLHHLMTHTSGMSDRGAIQTLDFPDRDEAVRRAMRSRFTAAPGEQWDYCNAGYVVLAAVVEITSGRPFEQYLREAIFLPAGMRDTGFIDGEHLDLSRGTARIITGRTGRPRRTDITGDGWGWGLRGAGGIVTTMNDLVKWERAIAAETILSAEAKKKWWTAAKDDYACGWFVETTDRGTRRVHHSGATRGYTCQVSMFPDEGMIVAVLTNELHSPHEIEGLVLAQLFPAETGGIEAVLTIEGLELNEYKGAELDQGVSVAAARDGDRVVLEVRREGVGVVARVAMTPRAARGLAGKIAAVAGKPEAEGAEGGERGAGGVSVMLGTMKYHAKDGRIELPPEVEWNVMPRYVGMADGKRIVDDRPTIILVDEPNLFWPLIIKAARPAAARLAAELTAAAAQDK